MNKRTKKIAAVIITLIVSIFVLQAFTTTETRVLTPAERMHDAIVCYADSFDVPLYVAFNIATLETGYRGPADSTYNPSQVSNKGAMGPMQIMYKYADYFAGHKVTKTMLRDSIEFNVRLSMKILARHYRKYNNWKTVAGVYNTGKPIHNKYAIKAADSTYFMKRWIKQDTLQTYASN
jgi:hypothetical protein